MKKQLLLLYGLAASICAFAQSIPVNKNAAKFTDDTYGENTGTLKMYCVTVVNENEINISDTYNRTTIGVELKNGSTYMREEVQYQVIELGFTVNPEQQIVQNTEVSKVTSITIGQYVQNIVGGAFVGFSNLKTFTCNATTPPDIAEGAMSGIPETANLVVPNDVDVLAAYRASSWADHFSLINGVPMKSTGVDKETDNEEPLRVEGRIVRLPKEEMVNVYNIAGVQIFSGVASEVELPSSGVFVVRTESQTTKFNCK